MRFRELCKWIGLGLWHSLACFYGTYFIWSTFGQWGDDIRAFGTTVGFNVVLVVNLKVRTPRARPPPSTSLDLNLISSLHLPRSRLS